MTNKELIEKIVSRIEEHKRLIKAEGYVGEGYALAHDHIVDIINQELIFAERNENND